MVPDGGGPAPLAEHGGAADDVGLVRAFPARPVRPDGMVPRPLEQVGEGAGRVADVERGREPPPGAAPGRPGSGRTFTAMQILIPDKVRARVGAYDWFVSLVIMPVGWVAMGPLSSSIGFTPTLVAAAAIGSVPCVLVAFAPQVRAVQRTPAGEIVGDAIASGRA